MLFFCLRLKHSAWAGAESFFYRARLQGSPLISHSEDTGQKMFPDGGFLQPAFVFYGQPRVKFHHPATEESVTLGGQNSLLLLGAGIYLDIPDAAGGGAALEQKTVHRAKVSEEFSGKGLHLFGQVAAGGRLEQRAAALDFNDPDGIAGHA